MKKITVQFTLTDDADLDRFLLDLDTSLISWCPYFEEMEERS